MTTFYRRHGKRLLDLALTIPALILLAPVMGVVALAVRLTMGRPVLFRQVRPGLHAQPFTMLKFRTMTDAHDATGSPLPDAPASPAWAASSGVPAWTSSPSSGTSFAAT